MAIFYKRKKENTLRAHMKKHIFEQRKENLRRLLKQHKLEALIVSQPANRYYLSGFELHNPQCNESAGYFIVTADGRQKLLTDPRYEDAALRLFESNEVGIYSAHRWQSIGKHLHALGIQSFGFESTGLCFLEHEKLKEQVQLIPTQGLLEQLRLIKDQEEIQRIKNSCALNHRLMDFIQGQLEPERSEKDIAWEIEKFFREQGKAEEMAFASIVGVGANAALPHAIPDQTPLRENELVLIDTGCKLHDYNSDQTRTFWIGKTPSERFRKTKDLVLKAQQAAIDVIRPGIAFHEAYAAAHTVFANAGEEKHFTHGLGHGIGLETHEAPSLSSKSKGIFKSGMIVTVEPGLYYPDWGGIRWEYMLLITEDGCEVL